MSFENYPFVKCLEPQRIKNKYTGEILTVGCGKCCACRGKRSASYATKCKLESMLSKYTYFITLTYNNEYVPLMECVNYDTSQGTYFYFIGKTSRSFPVEGEILSECDYCWSQLQQLSEKVGFPPSILPVLSVRDAQLFMKRFRKYCSKIDKYERVRYFLCGEYGTKSLRPHYHLLVWFDSEEIAKNMVEIVNQSWKFGFVDIQKVQRDASHYVAGYVNCVGSLPRIYQQGKCKPFSCHSRFLGEKFFKSQKEEAYKLTAKEFMRRSFKNTSIDSDIILWRSVTNWFYPRCRGYFASTSEQRKLFYTLMAKFAKRNDYYARPTVLAKEIVANCSPEAIIYVDKDIQYLVSMYNKEFAIESIYDCMHSTDDVSFLFQCREKLNSIICTIANDLRLSKHFLTNVCNSLNPIEIDVKLKMIDIFYKECEYMNLCIWYDMMNSNLESGDIDDVNLLYDFACVATIKDLKLFSKYKSYAQLNADLRMKHKRQNDANRIWFRERNL